MIVPPTLSVSVPDLRQGIQTLPGVGTARKRALNQLGIHTLGDLIEYFPRGYCHELAEGAISSLVSDQIQTVRGTIVACDYIPSRPRPRFEATLDDGTGKLAIVWFNGHYLRRILHPGQLIRVRGRVKFFRGLPQMANPKFQVITGENPQPQAARFYPVYPASSAISSDTLAGFISDNLDTLLQAIDEWFDPALLHKRRLIGRRQAYQLIHRPADESQAASARRRLIYDELMLMQLGLGIARRMREGRISAPIIKVDKLLDSRIRRRFPFELTTAQRNATFAIVRDMQSGKPMNRLLQGDVGSGKTIVALYAMLAAVANRLQSAMLAPTEVLAEQHFLTLSNLLRDSQVRIELFTSRTRRQSRGALLKALAGGQVHIAVGTQSLIQEDVDFANLGLVVVDEQHRLGVRQRAVLKGKGYSPHYLVMTATPIPRTLALSYFADFDVTTLDELPPGRQPIHTRWIRTDQAHQAWEFILAQVEQGRQAYIVMPRIEDDGLDETRSVKQEYERLSKGPLASIRLAMLHGQMTTDEKQRTMTDFRAGRIDALVATTVIEVGIDVPNATVMLIDNAERFGLSQLHQLRGRVGRGQHPSHCILLSDATGEEAEKRLRIFTQTSDGFEIAEQDLQLRGPGDFFGTRQHGLPQLKLADITRELQMLQQAKEDALTILQADPRLKSHPALRAALLDRFGDALALAQVG